MIVMNKRNYNSAFQAVVMRLWLGLRLKKRVNWGAFHV
jgi:hypothetical protein